MLKKTTRLRRLIFAPEIVVIPGVPDALCARIAEQEGFEAVFVGGYASTASLLGMPDVGLLSMTEMAEQARRICGAVDIPVFADGDTGHGNVTNVARTMREFERAGAAAIFFEDQVAPKRCGHMSGKQVIPVQEMVWKIQAAIDARVDADLTIMARTDALAIEGIDAAIERIHRYVQAGADMAFVESPESVEQMRKLTAEIHVPQLANMLPGGRTPSLTTAELQDIGFACVAHPTSLTYAVASAARLLLRELHTSGHTREAEGEMMQFEEFNTLVGLLDIREKEARFCTPRLTSTVKS
jgi:2,3-dimethylmalate lyase